MKAAFAEHETMVKSSLKEINSQLDNLGAYTLKEIQERIRVLEKKAVSDMTDP